MRIVVWDLIQVGAVLGVDVAERIYYSLAEEPRDAHAHRIDWLTIRAEIIRRRKDDP